MSEVSGTNIKTEVFDELVTEEGASGVIKIHKYTLSNGCMEVDVIEYGATVTAIRVPDRFGNIDDVALGYDDIKGYMATENNPYFGATIGRVANRIANGKFCLDGVTYTLSKNERDNTLHGGVVGFNRRVWRGCVDKEGLTLRLTSGDLDQGFPGQLDVEARFVVTPDHRLVITYSAVAHRPTPVNMTNHTYFNLAGHKSGPNKLYEHNLMINAYNFTPVDDFNIPKGKIQDVLDTVVDFTRPKNVGKAIESTEGGNGYDINFCVNGHEDEMRLVACLEHPDSGRRMVILSNQPGVQLYTANCTQVKEGRGKEGCGYSRHCALCLETQNYPDAINQKNFPSCVVRPSAKYLHVVSYQFSTFEQSKEDDEGMKSSVRVSNSSLSQSQGDAEKKSEPKEIAGSLKCEKLGSVSEEPTRCQSLQFPDLRLGSRKIQEEFNYEPMTQINLTDLQGYTNQEFQVILKECSTLIGPRSTKNFNFELCEDCTALNILTNTPIYPDWQLSEKLYVEKINVATDTVDNDEAKNVAQPDKSLSTVDKRSIMKKSTSKNLKKASHKNKKTHKKSPASRSRSRRMGR